MRPFLVFIILQLFNSICYSQPLSPEAFLKQMISVDPDFLGIQSIKLDHSPRWTVWLPENPHYTYISEGDESAFDFKGIFQKQAGISQTIRNPISGLYSGLAVENEIEAAHYRFKSGLLEYQFHKLTEYFQLWANHRQQVLYLSEINLVDSLLTGAQKRFQAGSLSLVDYNRLQLEFETGKTELTFQLMTLQNTYQSKLAGYGFQVLSFPDLPDLSEQLSFQDDTDKNYLQPDLQALTYQNQQENHLSTAVMWSWFPDIRFGLYELNMAGLSRNYLYSEITLSLPVFSIWEIPHDLEKSQLRVDRLKKTYQMETRKRKVETDLLINQLQVFKSGLINYKSQLNSYQTIASQYLKLALSGEKSITDYLDVRRQLMNTEHRWIATYSDYQILLARLLTIKGVYLIPELTQ